MNSDNYDNTLREEIRELTDIVELIGKDIQLGRKGSTYFGLCPWHDDTKPSLRVDPSRQSYKCFVCDIGGDVFSWVMKRQGVEFRESLAILADRAGVELGGAHYTEKRKQEKTLEPLYEAHRIASRLYEEQLWTNPEAQKSLEYLKIRGFSEDSIRQWELGYAPNQWEFTKNALEERLRDKFPNQDTKEIILMSGICGESVEGRVYDRFRNRIIFPVTDDKGQIVGFAGRVAPDNPSPAKYLNSPETPIYKKSNILYGFPEAEKAIKELGKVIVFEGYTDVILAHQNEIYNTVASMGTSFTREQIEKLNRRFPGIEINLCFDGDEPGQNSAFRNSKTLIGVRGTKMVFLPDGRDPADLIHSECKRKLKEVLGAATPLSAFYFDRLAKDRDLTVADQATEFLQETAQDLRQVPAHLLGVYITQLAKRTKLPQDAIEAVIFREPYRTTRGYESRGRGLQEHILLRGLIEFPKERPLFMPRLSPDMFTSPERRAVYEYLREKGTEELPLFTKLFAQQTHEIILKIAEKNPGTQREKLENILAPKKTYKRALNQKELETAYASLVGFDTQDFIERAKKRGYPLGKIEQAVANLKKELE